MNTILLLEDDLSLINGLSFALQKAGYQLEIARTLRQAEGLWQEGKYDLLILDVSLPDGSGFAFCEAVRQTSQVPIIFFNGLRRGNQRYHGAGFGRRRLYHQAF